MTMKISTHFTQGHEEEKIINGLTKLPQLFSAIEGDTDRILSILFYISIFSRLENNKLHIDCQALAANYRRKSPSPAMKHLHALTNLGFTFDTLKFGGEIKGMGKIHEISELIVSHEDADVVTALKIFAIACGINGRDIFMALDFNILSTDGQKPYKPSIEKTTAKIADILREERFSIISDKDKEFIIAFDEKINELGYDFGGEIGGKHLWGKFNIRYGKTGTKGRTCPARFYIDDNGAIALRLFLNKVDTHRRYIENSPPHIKSVFTTPDGDCQSCNTMCAPGKTYTIDGKIYQKCNHSTFYFHSPSIENIADYVGLLAK